ncbi:MAG TPA: hypothetical protein VF492_03460 [Verrucomicrobiae bacterium]|jgi:hypothetical protein
MCPAQPRNRAIVRRILFLQTRLPSQQSHFSRRLPQLSNGGTLLLDGCRLPIHLFQPVREKLDFSTHKTIRPGSYYEQIPAIACAAAFESFEPARDKDSFSSCLIFLWFQDYWALPIASHILTQIRKINWNDLAEDCWP